MLNDEIRLALATLDVRGVGADPNRSAPNTTGDVYDLVGNFRDQNLYANYPSSDHKAVWVDVTISAVPEPGAWLLMAGGLAVLAAAARRRRA